MKTIREAVWDKDLAHHRVALGNPSDAGRLLPCFHGVIASAKSGHPQIPARRLREALAESKEVTDIDSIRFLALILPHPDLPPVPELGW
jgi:hypothetical protein